MTSTITAHGRTYSTVREATSRITELEELNAEIGDSDGRVTEIILIGEAIGAAADAEQESKNAAFRAGQISDARRELALMKSWGVRNEPADHRIAYEEGGRIRVSRYTTEEGFLKAIIRLYSDPDRYAVMTVD